MYVLKTVQDFLIKLGIKPLMHLLEISIFSLNHDILRLTKIMNNLVKDLKILSFKAIFQCLNLVETFKKKICEEYLIRRPTYKLILRSLTRLLIILVSLTRSLFSEKMLISNRCISALMPKLIKKSWTVSTKA